MEDMEYVPITYSLFHIHSILSFVKHQLDDWRHHLRVKIMAVAVEKKALTKVHG
jgi:hypothetical protein